MIKEEDKTLFMLIADVHRQFGHKIRELEKKNGLGTCATCILIELDRNTSLTQVELVEKIHMRPSSISVALQKMELDGLINRTTKDDDQRYTLVTITEKGKKYCEEMRSKIHELDNSLTKKLTEEEVLFTKEVLRKLSLSFKEDIDENI